MVLVDLNIKYSYAFLVTEMVTKTKCNQCKNHLYTVSVHKTIQLIKNNMISYIVKYYSDNQTLGAFGDFSYVLDCF